MKLSVILIGLLLPFSSMLRAQVDWELDLDSVTVEATRILLPADRMGKHVTVIDQQVIRSLPANSIDELLRWIPGVEMQMRGIGGAQGDISVRGSTFNQVLVLLDGVRVNDPLTGHFSAYVPVPVSSIKRIELLRGPAAAQYGSDAVGAVINVITFNESGTEKGLGLDVQGMLGEQEWVSWDGTVGLGGEEWRVELGSQSITTDGHEIDTAGNRSDVESRQFTVGAKWTPSPKWDLQLRGAWDDRDFAAKYFYTRSTFDESREQVSRVFSVAQLRYQPVSDQSLYLRAGFQVTTDSFLFNPAFPGNFHTTRHWDIQTGYQFRTGPEWTWQGGVQGIYSEIQSNDRGDRDHFRGGGFLLTHWSPGNGWEWHGGIRLEYDEVFQWAFNPQAAVHYQAFPWLGLRAFGGRGIRAADFTERFVSTRLPGVLSSGRNVGNPDLNAENSWSFEAGADLRWPRKLLHRMTVFNRQSTDLIDYVLTPGADITNVDNVDPASSYFYAQNIATLRTTGMEYIAEFKHLWKADRWIRLSSGVTWLNFGGSTDTPSKYLANASRVLWQNALSLQWGRSNLTVQHLFKARDGEAAEAIGAELEDQYHLVNVRASLRPFGFIPVSILVQVDNLLDQQYSDILGAVMPGRWVKGGLRLQF